MTHTAACEQRTNKKKAGVSISCCAGKVTSTLLLLHLAHTHLWKERLAVLFPRTFPFPATLPSPAAASNSSLVAPHKRPQKFSLHVLHRSRSASRSSATSAAPSPASSLDPLCPPRSRDRGLRSGCQTPGMDAAGSDADDKAKLSRFSNWKLTVGLAISKRWEWEEYATREAAWLMVITVIH